MHDGPEVTKFQLEAGIHPLWFCKVPITLVEMLRVTLMQGAPPQIVEVGQNRNFVTQEMESLGKFTMARELFYHRAATFVERERLEQSWSRKRERPPSDFGTGPKNKKSPVMSLPSTALPLLPNVRVGDIVAQNAKVSSVELICTAGNACKQLWISMISVAWCIKFSSMPAVGGGPVRKEC